MNERSHCPYLGLRQNRAIRFASPTSEHRCYVTGEAQDIPVEQRTHCLSINHLSCPLYTGEWSGTTSGQLAGAGALALPRNGVRGRLGNRDNIFYFVVVGLIFLITLVWVGIYLLYTFGDTGLGAVAVVPPTTTSTTAPPTTTSTTAPPTVTLTPDVPPALPSGLTAASVSTNGVLLEWENKIGQGVRGYNVYRSDSVDGTFDKLNLRLIGAAQYNDAAAPRGKTSYYRVTAVDGADRESKPATIRVGVPSEPPTPTLTPTATATITPTATLAPTLAATQTPVIIREPVYVPVPVAPSRTPVPPPATMAPTNTPEPPMNTPEPPTNTPEPTAVLPTPWNTPIPAATEVPTPQPMPTQTQVVPTNQTSADVPTIVLTPETPPASEVPSASPVVITPESSPASDLPIPSPKT